MSLHYSVPYSDFDMRYRLTYFSIFLFSLLFVISCGSDSGDNEPFDTSEGTDDADVSDVRQTDGFEDSSDAEISEPEYIDVDPQATRPVTKRGQYNVGYRERTVEYEPEGDGSDETRQINLAVWYPTLRKDGPPGDYYEDVFTRPEVIAKAEVAPVEDTPLLVFSHGSGSLPQQSVFMTEYWASHGWVVVSPAHKGNLFEDGFNVTLDTALKRPQDIIATLDHVEKMDKQHPIRSKIDFDKIAMSGHSFGAYTTFANTGAGFSIDRVRRRCEDGEISEEYCSAFEKDEFPEEFEEGFEDDRIDLGIPQAPPGADIYHEGLTQIDVPMMVYTGGMDITLTNENQGDPIWKLMEGDQHRRINMPKAGHFTFSNMCEYFGDVPRVREDGCGEDNIKPKRAHEIINAYSLAFARYHLDLDGAEQAEKMIDSETFPVGKSGFEYMIGAEPNDRSEDDGSGGETDGNGGSDNSGSDGDTGDDGSSGG